MNDNTKYTYRNDIETRKKPKSKVKAKLPAENADIWWLQ